MSKISPKHEKWPKYLRNWKITKIITKPIEWPKYPWNPKMTKIPPKTNKMAYGLFKNKVLNGFISIIIYSYEFMVSCSTKRDIDYYIYYIDTHIMCLHYCCGGLLFWSKRVACMERKCGVFSIRSVVCFVTYIFETQCEMVKS